MLSSSFSGSNKGVVSISNPLRKNASQDVENSVNAKYSTVLDYLLTPPQVKEQLMKSQSLEKKMQTIDMHKKLFEVGPSSADQRDIDTSSTHSAASLGATEWGDREEAILATIQKAKIPDIQLLSKLKVMLSSANRLFMSSFIASGGLAVLLKIIEARLMKRPLTELDIAILYEILSCCKVVMNNPVGIEEIAKMPNAIDIFTRCLRFEYKLFAVEVLEILSVCAFYSETTAQTVHASMRQHARYYQEAPFASLCNALVEQDIEVKAAIIIFVHSLIMGVGDANIRLTLRTELACQLFDEKLDLANIRLEKELAVLEDVEAQSAQADSASAGLKSKLRRRSLVTVHGPKAIDERKIEAMIQNNQLDISASHDLAAPVERITARSNNLTMHVSPLEGTMAGLMHAAKNTEKIESKFLDMVGGKKTKRRWYELTNDAFKWCGGHDKEAEYKGAVSMGAITDIRPFSTDPYLLASTAPKLHCFEIETSERVYSFGVETEKDKDHWLTAFQRARENFMISKGTYKVQYRELSAADVVKFAAIFCKYTEIYTSIAIEDRRSQVENCGLNLDNVQDLMRFLIHETTAMGSVGRLQQILFELVTLPAGAEGAWDAVYRGIVSVREGGQRTHSAQSIVELFQHKIKSSGSAYTQVHNLALKVMDHENEIERLQEKVKELEDANARLRNTPAGAMAQFSHASRHVPLPPASAALQSDELVVSPARPVAAPPLPPLAPPDVPLSAALAAPTPISESASLSAPPPLPPRASMRAARPPPPPVPPQPLSAVAAPALPPVVHLPLSLLPAVPVSPAVAEHPAVLPARVEPIAAPPTAVDERYAKFDKMRKMLPEGAVRQKMMLEGFSEREIDAFFNGEVVSTASTAPAAPPAADGRFAKFEKMRKMLPEGAVRQKMMLEGFSESEIDTFFSGQVTAGSVAAAAPAPAPLTPAAAVDERYAKFDKMRKMLPEGAVRQKMMLEGFSEREIDAFFNGQTVAAAPAAPVPVAAAPVDERFAKFEKMRKMLPEGAVRQKMSIEGFSEAEINAFFSGQIATAAAPAAPAAPAADERYAKYDKMRKMLPEGAVRQKMTTDGFSAAEIDAFFSGAVAPAAVAAPAPVVDDRFAKYDKMRKMLPEGAVRQKMTADGFSAQEIDSFFGVSGAAAPAAAPRPVVAAKPAVPAADAPPEGMEAKPKVKPSVKLKGLFWTKMKSLEVQNTIWYRLQEHGLSEENRKMLEEWFAAKVADTSAAAAGGGAAGGASGKGSQPQQPKLVSVLDGKRTQNVLILMGKLRKGPEEITQLLVSLDPTELTAELTTRLIENLPTAEEITAIKAFKDSKELDNASKLIFELNRIPRLNQRMECHELTFLWGNNANTASKDLNVLVKAIKELVDTKSAMETILAMILAIGNHINGDTARGQAYGVKIDIFSKLVNLKAMLPSQGSLMNFLALMIEQHSPKAIEFSQSWVAVWVAADISFKQLQTDVNQLETQINKVNMELGRIKQGPENPGLDGTLEDINGALTKPLHSRLTNFLSTARPQLQTMKETISSVEGNLEKLMNEYGESLKSNVEGDPCKRFFSIVVDFAKAFQAAHDDNVAKRQAQEKAAKALAEAESKSQQQASKPNPMASMASMAMLAKAAAARHQKGASTGDEPAQENLFGRFHEAQNASTGDVLASFKSQLNKRLASVPK